MNNINIEVGKTYITRSNERVLIKSRLTYNNNTWYEGDNKLNYNSDGKCWYALMFKGVFHAPKSDIISEVIWEDGNGY
jgi:hypothetical protein